MFTYDLIFDGFKNLRSENEACFSIFQIFLASRIEPLEEVDAFDVLLGTNDSEVSDILDFSIDSLAFIL